jgi:hypothetical protein
MSTDNDTALLVRLTSPPGTTAPWAPAMESLLEAFTTIERITHMNHEAVREHGFLVDRELLKDAQPFMWSKDVIAGCLAASRSIPTDTVFNAWNLPTPAVWWWFEDPLPFKTLDEPRMPHDVPVRAICFGWLQQGRRRVLGISAWCDSYGTLGNLTITPSQTWIWDEAQTLAGMLESARFAHVKMYGKGGKYKDIETVGVDVFCSAAEGLSRFVLAGLAWLGQRIVTESAGHIERHRRKDFNRRTGQALDAVRVVQLRRQERLPSVGPHEPSGVTYTCQWTVDGHFRNQACGPGNADRRLTWISPYIKGPDDQPLRIPKRKVYVVNR